MSQGSRNEKSRLLQKLRPSDFPTEGLCLITVGKHSSGKSTALDNIFGLQQSSFVSDKTSTTTTGWSIKRATKNGINISVISVDETDVRLEDLPGAIRDISGSKEYILLYCLSVAPSRQLTAEDGAVWKNLQSCLGKEVWSHCVVLLTSCDKAWQVKFAADKNCSGYVEHLNSVAEEFGGILKEVCGSNVPAVRTVFNRPSKEGVEGREDDCIAFPVSKKLNSSKDILPGVNLDSNKNWTDVVFDEILKKSLESDKGAWLRLKYGSAAVGSSASSALMGLAVGAGIGAMVGAVAGPLGMLSAGSVGAATGVAIARAIHKKRRQNGAIWKFSRLKIKED